MVRGGVRETADSDNKKGAIIERRQGAIGFGGVQSPQRFASVLGSRPKRA